jgi:hypothetical protein
MKCSEKYRTYRLKEHVKERHAEEERNRYHSTKTAQLAADVDDVIKATKKKRSRVEVPARTQGRYTARRKSGS